MRNTILAVQWLIRACAIVQITVGVLFWTGNAYGLVQPHMLTGMVLVLGLWTQAVLATRVGLGFGVAALALVWGVVVVALGMTQASLLPGDWHWLVRVVHLLIGVGAVGLAESLARRARVKIGTSGARGALA